MLFFKRPPKYNIWGKKRPKKLCMIHTVATENIDKRPTLKFAYEIFYYCYVLL